MSLNGKKYSRSVEIQGEEEVVTVQYRIPRDAPTYMIPEDPVSWARAVPSRVHGMWDSQKKLKMHLGLFIQRAHQGRPLYQGPLLLDIKFCFPFNQQMKKDPARWEDSWYYYRPDADNCCKLILDTCNTVLYDDDKTTVTVLISKVYSQNPRTEFRVVELK
jgi:Holliday junction resolvase RusA-like endonuclease